MRGLHTVLTAILILFIVSGSAFGQSLERNANYIKENFPKEYQQTIRQHAVDEWGTDYRMVVYQINQQADALFELVSSFKSENTNIAFSAIQQWSHDGYTSSNVEAFKKAKTFGVKQLIGLHCDWRMVKYTYDKQVKAKNSF